jgi:hypothetical protein
MFSLCEMLGQTPMAQLLGYGIGRVNTLSQFFSAKLQLLSAQVHPHFASNKKGYD